MLSCNKKNFIRQFFFLLQDKMHAQNRCGQTSACQAYFSLLVSALDFPEYLFTRNGTLFE
jgi:hypothetical protein